MKLINFVFAQHFISTKRIYTQSGRAFWRKYLS